MTMTQPPQSPILGASACVFRAENVLLIQRAKPPRIGAWSLPGGHVEWGETCKDAAERELQEETGLHAMLPQFVGLYDIFRKNQSGVIEAHYAIACYAGSSRSGETHAGSDAMAVRWVSIKDLQPYDLADNILDAIASAQKLLRV